MTAAGRAAARALGPVEDALAAIKADLAELSLRGARSTQATITALAVAVSATLAMAGHMDMPWWAAISGFMSVQATRPGSVTRATLRIVGTAAGAAVAFAIAPFILHDEVAGLLFLFVSVSVGILGCLVSPHAYAWLFGSITANLVILLSIADPSMTLHYAFYRTLEVTIGSVTALAIVLSLAPAGELPAAGPTPPGWTDLLGARWPAVLHALRTGLTVTLLPLTWSFFDLPGLSQMAITVAAVMAVPVLTDHPLEQGRLIAGRAAQRVGGCLLGGLVGLATLAVSPATFAPWLVLLTAGVWLGAYMQASTRGVGYVGTQATVVFIMTLVQGWGPPASIIPAIDRFVGIVLGITMLLIVSLLFWPEEPVLRRSPGTASLSPSRD